MEKAQRPRVLCVDDEPNVLAGLALHLRRRYDVETAESGMHGLELLRRAPVAVVISDMRMPGMDGAAFLSRVRSHSPDTVRLLLTGQADLESAIAAVNEGQIFRFLTKPLPPPALLACVDAAAEQHRLVTAERVLLEQTLHGSVKTLTDILALTNPVAFGRATRVRQLASELAQTLQVRERWQLEVAAMLSQLGCITLPGDTVEKVYYGHALSQGEREMVAKLPAVTEGLLANIPRLEAVRAIIAAAPRPYQAAAQKPGEDPVVAEGAQLLRVAIDFDELERQGLSAASGIDTMHGRASYDPRVLEALSEVRGGSGPADDVREVPVSGLRPGMVLAQDVKTTTGVLLAARGYEVTNGFVARVANFRGSVKEPLRVVVKREA
jgi:CheY-like chemotaxis protein